MPFAAHPTTEIEEGGVDAALTLLRDALLGLNDAATAIHQGGVTHPTYEQIEAFAHRCVLAGLSSTGLRRRFETLPPSERNRTMTAVVEQWAVAVERNIAQRLGEPTSNNEAA